MLFLCNYFDKDKNVAYYKRNAWSWKSVSNAAMIEDKVEVKKVSLISGPLSRKESLEKDKSTAHFVKHPTSSRWVVEKKNEEFKSN